MEQILCSDCSQGSLLGNKVDKANVSTVQGIYIMNGIKVTVTMVKPILMQV